HLATWYKDVPADADLQKDGALAYTGGTGEHLNEMQVTESPGHRHTKREIMRIGARPQWSILRVVENSGFAAFDGQSFPMVSDFHIGRDEYKARSEKTLWDFVDDPRQVIEVPVQK